MKPERALRKDRDTALSLIVEMLAANPETGYKAADIAMRLGLGRERVGGFLRLLAEDSKVEKDSWGRFRWVTDEKVKPTEAPPLDIGAWFAEGRRIFGRPFRVELEVHDA